MEMKNVTRETGNNLTDYLKVKPAQDKSGGFEAALKKADERPQEKARNTEAPRKNSQPKHEKQNSTNPVGKETPNVDQRKEGVTESEPVETKVESTDQTVEDKVDVNGQIVKRLSEELSVPEEKIMQILNSLNITATELEDKSNMNEFLMNLFEVTDTVGLLDVPGISQTIQSVNQVLDEFTEQPTESGEPSVKLPQQAQQTAKDTTIAEVLPETVETDSSIMEKSVVPAPKTDKTGDTNVQADIDSVAEEKTVEVGTPSAPKTNTGAGQEKKEDTGESLLKGDLAGQDDDHAVTNGMSTQPVINDKVQFAQTVARNIATQNINTQDVVDQIVNKMKVEIRGNISEVRLTLRPENLGDVSLRIATDNGIVTAHFVAENQRIKEIIESNFNNLKNVLQEQGIEVTSLSVSVGGNEQEQRMQQFMQGRQQALARAGRIQNGVETVEDDAVNVDIDTHEVYDSSVDFSA